MDMRDLKCFVTVCRHMNFTNAGKELHISQQGISKIIKQLEADLGVTLFIRENGAKLKLTEYGAYLLPIAKDVCREFDVMEESIRSFIEKDRGKLRIAIPRGMTWELIGSQLQSFYNHYSGTQLMITQYDDLGVENALLNQTADIGFCIAPIPENVFNVHKKYKACTRYMISTQNPLSRMEKLSIHDMKGQRFIGFGENNKGHGTLKRFCEAEGFEPVLYAEVNDMNILYQMVKENQGVGFYVGDIDKAAPVDGIRIIEDTSEGWYWEILMSTSKKHALRPIDTAFINEFKTWE